MSESKEDSRSPQSNKRYFFWSSVTTGAMSIGLGAGAGIAGSLGDSKAVIGVLGAGSGITFVLTLIALWKLSREQVKLQADSNSNNDSLRSYCFRATTMGLAIAAGIVQGNGRFGTAAYILLADILVLLAWAVVAYQSARKSDAAQANAAAEGAPGPAESNGQKKAIDGYDLYNYALPFIYLLLSVATAQIVREAFGLPLPMGDSGP